MKMDGRRPLEPAQLAVPVGSIPGDGWRSVSLQDSLHAPHLLGDQSAGGESPPVSAASSTGEQQLSRLVDAPVAGLQLRQPHRGAERRRHRGRVRGEGRTDNLLRRSPQRGPDYPRLRRHSAGPGNPSHTAPSGLIQAYRHTLCSYRASSQYTDDDMTHKCYRKGCIVVRQVSSEPSPCDSALVTRTAYHITAQPRKCMNKGQAGCDIR